MTQENKQLLLKDLCTRLPYKVKLGFENSDLILIPEEFNIYTMQLSTNQIYPKVDRAVIKHIYDIWNYRPYLRSMSSMTEEELKELNVIFDNCDTEYRVEAQDWLISHYFDFRELIERGLALEAPEDMYRTE